MSKNDEHAVRLWGPAYDAIPKSVFATIAWHLANVTSDSADQEGAAEKRFLEELRVLGHNEIIPKAQVVSVLRALEKVLR